MNQGQFHLGCSYSGSCLVKPNRRIKDWPLLFKHKEISDKFQDTYRNWMLLRLPSVDGMGPES